MFDSKTTANSFSCRVRASAVRTALPNTGAEPAHPGALPSPDSITSACFEHGGRLPTAVYTLGRLKPGHSVLGPALLMDSISTIVIEPGCTAHVTGDGDVRIDVASSKVQHSVNNKTRVLQLTKIKLFLCTLIVKAVFSRLPSPNRYSG